MYFVKICIVVMQQNTYFKRNQVFYYTLIVHMLQHANNNTQHKLNKEKHIYIINIYNNISQMTSMQVDCFEIKLNSYAFKSRT